MRSNGKTRQAVRPKEPPKVRNGAPLLTPEPGAGKPCLELINRLRD